MKKWPLPLKAKSVRPNNGRLESGSVLSTLSPKFSLSLVIEAFEKWSIPEDWERRVSYLLSVYYGKTARSQLDRSFDDVEWFLSAARTLGRGGTRIRVSH
jgi:hypothetical protein